MKLSCLQIPLILHFYIPVNSLCYTQNQHTKLERSSQVNEIFWIKLTEANTSNPGTTAELLEGKGQAEVPSTTSSGHTALPSQPLHTEPSSLPGFLGAGVMKNLSKDNKTHIKYLYFLTAQSTSLSNTTSTLQQPPPPPSIPLKQEFLETSSQEIEESQQKDRWAAENLLS